MGWGNNADHEQDGVYGLELIPETGDELRAERRETIGSDGPRHLLRTLRIIGFLAFVGAFTIALWSSGTGSKPTPAPARIRVARTELAPSGRIATLTLVLANDAPSSASVGEAEILDADGHRIGADRLWPAGEIPANSMLAVDIPVPYDCDTHIPQHQPIALHVSVSSPLDPGAPQYLSYPLDPQAWQKFEHYQSGICSSGDSASVNIGAVSVAGTDPATHSVKILIPVSVGEPLTVDEIYAPNHALRFTADPAPPLTLPSSGWQAIATTWQVADCRSMAGQWNKQQLLVLAYEGPTGGTSVTIALPADVVAQLSATACPH